MDMKYLETGSVDPAYNLAFEEYVLTNRKDDAYLLLWQNDKTIVVGQNQNTLEEIDLPFVEANGIQVVRRITGGGAVYHDLGNLNYSFITDAGDPEQLTMDAFTAPVVEALRALGLRAEASGRNDILVEGRKVSGTAQSLRDGRVLFHGTLLFDSDADAIAAALRADPEKFRSKSSKSVRSRVGNIRDFLKEDMRLSDFWVYLRRSFGGNLTPDSLTPEELAAVRQLKAGKYDTWEWNFGRSPRYDMTTRRRWAGGSLTVSMAVNRGVIEEIAFRGDFLSLRPLAEVEEALRGQPCRREAVAAVLERYALREYFGAIPQEEILQTMF